VSSEHAALSQLVDELLDAVDGLVPATARHDLEQALSRLDEDRLNLVVLGEFKRGKSTLVNALLEHDVVPTGVLPLTAAVIAVRHGPAPRLLVEFADGKTHEARLEEVGDFATETGNPENRRRVRLVTIEVPSPLLAAGLQLVDTPGIGSVFAHNTETALGFLGQVDAGLFTLAADQPLSVTEEELIREASERLPRLFFALNKIDRLDLTERGEVTEFVRGRLMDLVGGEPELHALSAWSGEGLDDLRRQFEELGYGERSRVVKHSVRTSAARFSAEAIQAVRFEAHAVELPAAELDRRLAEFRGRVTHLERTREEAAELLLQGARRLVREQVDEPLLTLAGREGRALVEAMRGFAGDQRSLAPGKLAASLEEWSHRTITERFERLSGEYERTLAGELGDLHERYVERIDHILGELDDAAAEVFGERVGRLVQPVSLRRPSQFTFKLRDAEREFLDQLASAATASMPGRLGRRLVLRQAEERLRLLLDRHAGRLRSDLAQRVRESIHDYAQELASTVRDAVSAVEAAVERAARDHAGGRRRVDERLVELRGVERRLAELAVAVASEEPA
jgi:GTPase Era involved in 16S rRNA processing